VDLFDDVWGQWNRNTGRPCDDSVGLEMEAFVATLMICSWAQVEAVKCLWGVVILDGAILNGLDIDMFQASEDIEARPL